jgi:uncharacterized phage-like protein YoqJ
MISGLALGWDTAWAIAALRHNIPLTVAIPFEGQEKRWPEAAQRRYREIRAAATKVVVCAFGGYSPEAMHGRNKWMVDNSQAVAALWNGDSTGGTAHCIRECNRVGRYVENLWSEYLTFVVSFR